MTQLEIYKAMRRMLNKSAIVTYNGERVYTVEGNRYRCVVDFLRHVIKDMPSIEQAFAMSTSYKHAEDLGVSVWEAEEYWFTSLDYDMTKGMAERSKFIDDLIKLEKNEK